MPIKVKYKAARPLTPQQLMKVKGWFTDEKTPVKEDDYNEIKAALGAAGSDTVFACFRPEAKAEGDAKDAFDLGIEAAAFEARMQAIVREGGAIDSKASAPVVSSSPVTPLSPSPSPLASDAKTATATPDAALSAKAGVPASLPDKERLEQQEKEFNERRDELKRARDALGSNPQDLAQARGIERRILNSDLGVGLQVSGDLKNAEKKESEARSYLEGCNVALKKAKENGVGEAEAEKALEQAKKDFKTASETVDKLRGEEQKKLEAALYQMFGSKCNAVWSPLPDVKSEKGKHDTMEIARRDYLVAMAKMEAWLIARQRELAAVAYKKDDKDPQPQNLDDVDKMDWSKAIQALDKASKAYTKWLEGLSTSAKNPTTVGSLRIVKSHDGKTVACKDLDPNSIEAALKALDYLIQHVPPTERPPYMVTPENLSKDVEKALMRKILDTTTVCIDMSEATVHSNSVKRVLLQRRRLADLDGKSAGDNAISLPPPRVPGLAMLWIDACQNETASDSNADKNALIEVLKGDPQMLYELWQQLCTLPSGDPKNQLLKQFLDAKVGRKLRTAGTTAERVSDVLWDKFFSKASVTVGESAEKDKKEFVRVRDEVTLDAKVNFGARESRGKLNDDYKNQYAEPQRQYGVHLKELKAVASSAAPIVPRSAMATS